MINAFSTRRHTVRTLVLLVGCCLLAVAAAGVGISDNPPGILLAFLAATAFVLAFVHPWKASKQFTRLLAWSALGIIAFAVLHNVFEAIASNLGGRGVLYGVLNGIGGALFLFALIVCPMGLLVGAIGAAVMSRREHKSQTSAPSV